MSRAIPAEKEKLEALAQMDLVKIMRGYILGVVHAAQGYKALLVDKDTMKIASTLLGRTELGEHGVVLVERLETKGKMHSELKAMCFVRPTRDNIKALKEELKAPRFQSYHLFFTNLVNPIHLQELAEVDAVKEQVQEVQEYYGDFVVNEPNHFTVPAPKNELLLSPAAGARSPHVYEQIDRFVQGLSALFLAIRRRPVIRYQGGSEVAQRLADSLYQLTYKQQYQIFDFGARSNPIVLLLDRKDDPVTPLLTQWTYQAMIHELLGMWDGKVEVKPRKPKAGEEPKTEPEEMVLDPQQDEFFRKHMYSNYGEVGVDVQLLLTEFQTKNKLFAKVESLEDMKRFIAEHDEFRKLQNNVTKHINIMSEIGDIIAKRNLMEVSSAEQELANPAANMTAAASYDEVMRLLRLLTVGDKDKVRLVMLYALRFEADSLRVRQMTDFLGTLGIRDREPQLFAAVDLVLQHAGNAKRAGDLYASRSVLNKVSTMFRGLRGVENVYTQHTPLLTATLSLLSQDKLDPVSYPYMAATQDDAVSYQAAFKRSPPREVIVFIVGGSTYEESKSVRDWNERNPGMRVILGGSAVLNSDTFLAGLASQTASGDSLEIR